MRHSGSVWLRGRSLAPANGSYRPASEIVDSRRDGHPRVEVTALVVSGARSQDRTSVVAPGVFRSIERVRRTRRRVRALRPAEQEPEATHDHRTAHASTEAGDGRRQGRRGVHGRWREDELTGAPEQAIRGRCQAPVGGPLETRGGGRVLGSASPTTSFLSRSRFSRAFAAGSTLRPTRRSALAGRKAGSATGSSPSPARTTTG
jgi:hypothetical protein